MKRFEKYLIVIPICFTILVAWFSWNAFKSAPLIAAENLKGAALTVSDAIEHISALDSDYSSLGRYTTGDIAYFYLTDQHGIIRFHTNRALIGSMDENRALKNDGGIVEGREIIGTGEEVYLLKKYIHNKNKTYLLSLALHTYRADSVIRRATAGVTIVIFLTASLWLVTILIFFLLRRNAAQQESMRRKEELARLGELGAVMAHEIRNPLAGIKGFAQLVETSADIGKAHHYADKIVAQSMRMENLVNDLLSYTRQDCGDKQAADLSTIIRDCISLVQMEAPKSRYTITANGIENPLKIIAASNRIIQLLLNLLKNGLQAMPDSGTLNVSVVQDNKNFTISIRDSGMGIPAENLSHIFEPFWTSKAKGTGLGLALCQKIAQEHGGTIKVDSTIGVGTAFTVVLSKKGVNP